MATNALSSLEGPEATTSRRSFLRTALLLPFTFSLAGSLCGVSPANALPVAAVIAVAQVAVSVAKLFSSGGPSTNDLLARQAEMLEAISQQLAVIHQELQVVLQRLDEIQQKLGALPGEVVTELQRQTIRTLPILYTAMRRAYDQDVRSMGVTAARRHHVQPLQDQLLTPLIQSRTVLLGSPSKIHVPVLALALHIEIAVRILVDGTDGDIDSAMNSPQSYGDWFRARTKELSQELVNLRNSCQEARAKVASMERDLNCLFDKSDLPRFGPVGDGIDIGGIRVPLPADEIWLTSYRTRVGRLSYKTTAASRDTDFDSLLVLGLMSEDDLPYIVEIAGSKPPVSAPQVGKVGQLPQQPTCDSIEAPLETMAKELTATLTDSSYVIAADLALLDCASRALAAIERWSTT